MLKEKFTIFIFVPGISDLKAIAQDEIIQNGACLAVSWSGPLTVYSPGPVWDAMFFGHQDGVLKGS